MVANPAPLPRADSCEVAQHDRQRAFASSEFTLVDGPMRRTIAFEAGYDHTSYGCDHGRHGMQLRFTLAGPSGATQWMCFMTNWLPGNVDRIGNVKALTPISLVPIPEGWPDDGMAADLGYHSPVPMYEDQARMECTTLPEGYCYYDGSGLNAEPVLEAFLRHGPMAVWAALARYYTELFDDPTKEEP